MGMEKSGEIGKKRKEGIQIMENTMRNTEKFQELRNEIQKVIVGNEPVIEKIITAILAGGHILLEDIPGVGKTTMALTFSKVLGLDYKRIQFTPDTLPSDVVGFSIYQKEKDAFVYKPGAVMTNLLLADEINRTSSKTQAALLEVMEEGNTTVDGVTYALPKPFIVISTQNPFGYAGTQMLPQSQMDRFFVCLSMGMPDKENLKEILRTRRNRQPLQEVSQIFNKEILLQMQREVKQVHVSEEILDYIADLMQATNRNSKLELGVSPRGALAVMHMSQAYAYMQGKSYVVPGDIAKIFVDTCAHRVTLTSAAKSEHLTGRMIVSEILAQAKEPIIQAAGLMK